MKKITALFLVVINFFLIFNFFSLPVQAAYCPGRCLTQAEVDKLKVSVVPADQGSCDNGFICANTQIQGPISNDNPVVTSNNPDTKNGTSIQKCPSGKGDCVIVENPLNTPDTDVETIIGIVIQAALGLIGSITLFMLVWGGFQWLVAAGNEEKIKKGTQTMIWAVIGLFLVMSSYILLTTYLGYLTGSK